MMSPWLKILGILFLASINIAAKVQKEQAIVKGQVISSKKQPVVFAEAALVNLNTKNIVVGMLCNNLVEYAANNLNKGEYMFPSPPLLKTGVIFLRKFMELLITTMATCVQSEAKNT